MIDNYKLFLIKKWNNLLSLLFVINHIIRLFTFFTENGLFVVNSIVILPYFFRVFPI